MQIFMKLVVVALLLALGMGIRYLAVGQTRNSEAQTPQRDVERVESKPDLAIDYSRVARLKLASRKQNYHMGDLVSLDFAILNTTNVPVFFSSSPDQSLTARDPNGNSFLIRPYLEVFRGASATSYKVVQPHRIMARSFQMMISCDQRALAQFGGSERRNDEQIFEQDAFVNWGSLCLNIQHSGTYLIMLEFKNDHVVVSSSPPETAVKTAVGGISSNALRLDVVD